MFNFKNALDDYGNSEGKEIILKADPLIRSFSQKMDATIEKEWQKKSLEELLEAPAS